MLRLKENILPTIQIVKVSTQFFVLYESAEHTGEIDQEDKLEKMKVSQHQVGPFPKKENGKQWIEDNLFININ